MLDSRLFTLFGSLVLLACSDGVAFADGETAESRSSLAGTGAFVDARWYFSEAEHMDAWYALTTTLRENFDDVCGDTFCEGDYSNYESLGFRCSVDQNTGILGSCVWLFAASTDEVVPETGQIQVQWRHWRCRVPLARRTSVDELLDTLSAAGTRPIDAALPRMSASIYEGLVGCL